MTDIIDIFLAPPNVALFARMYRITDCMARRYMTEFIYGPYMAGLYDLWTGTDADLYLRHMNDEFIKFMGVVQRRAAALTPERIEPSARVEIASYSDPFDRAGERGRRREMAAPRRPIMRGSGASCEGASGSRACPSPWSCSLPTSATRTTDSMYAQWNRDQRGVVHLSARDDEGSDVGVPLDYTCQFAASAERPLPYDTRYGLRDLSDPQAGSGEAQYHLLVLDEQMSVLNQERTIPYGYGSTEEQLADDARVAARHRGFRPEEGVIMKTNYKKLIRVQAPNGRVTLDDDRKMALDIFSRDSKGFILSGRR